jgi:hypothetical protein
LTEYNGSTKGAASAQQLWRMNVLGLVTVRDDPGEPLMRLEAKEILAEAVRLGLWHPVRGERQEVRSG